MTFRHGSFAALATLSACCALVLAPAAQAQTRGAWLASGVTYQAPLNTSTLGGHTLFGAAFGHPLNRTLALAVSAAMGTGLVRAEVGAPTYVAGGPSLRRTHLDLGAELRSRVRGGRDLDQSELYVIAGFSILRTHLANEEVALQPQAHAGLAITLPFAEAVGAEARVAYVSARLTPGQIGIAADTARWTASDGTSGLEVTNNKPRWYGAIRAGLSFYLRPVTRPRRIPPQYVPDATAPVEPTSTFEGSLLDRADAVAEQMDSRDDKLGADPSAGSGGTIRGDYLVKIPSPQPVTAKGKGRRAPKDSLTVLAGALPDVTQPVPAAGRTTTAPVQAGAPRLDAEPARVANAPIRTPVPDADDSVVSESDATTEYLVIRPVIVGGHLRPASADRLVALAARYLAGGRVLDYAIVLESASADQATSDLLLEDAYALRARLITAGVAPTRVLVREVASDRASSALRILLRSPKSPSAPRGQ